MKPARPLRALIVDDEPLARLRMHHLLREQSDVRICAECGDAAGAATAIAQQEPDVVFLDITMPGTSGLEFVRKAGLGRRPLIVLVTAHAEFAVEAFECRAVDYLLKPVRPERLAKALERVRELLAATPTIPSTADVPPATAHTAEPAGGPLRAVMVRNGGRILLVPVADIESIEAAGNYLVLHVGTANHVHRSTLSELEERLDPAVFLRVNRSALVHKSFVRALEVTGPGEYDVVLRSGRRLKVTRSLKELRAQFESGR